MKCFGNYSVYLQPHMCETSLDSTLHTNNIHAYLIFLSGEAYFWKSAHFVTTLRHAVFSVCCVVILHRVLATTSLEEYMTK